MPAGTSLSSGASLLRQAAGKPWEFTEKNATLFTRDLLLTLPGGKARVQPRPNSVEVTLAGNVPELSTFAGLESAIVLHDSRALDLDLSLVRGRIVLVNRKADGQAKVWVRLPSLVEKNANLPPPALGLVLNQPGDSVALEVYGRWPRGVPFRKTPLPHETPTRAMQLVVLQGQVQLKTPTVTHTLSAPPGSASFLWDSVVGPASTIQRLDKLPSWANPTAEEKAQRQRMAKLYAQFEEVAKGKSPGQALTEFSQRADLVADGLHAMRMREFSVYGQVALGNIGKVAQALEDADHPAVRAAAILALRNFIGEMPGRDQQVFGALRQRLDYSEAEAGTILQMLHSPFVVQQPETYQTLLAYLRHSRLSIRALAHWHLVRLFPDGTKIAFDAGASEAKRTQAWNAWKQLLDSKTD